ncbi:MAG: glycosyltransferase family 1 protein, partial [Chloroflexi bacterium]|nr:glycosyltransferase family 1 protein [Chloroflexota bacterium]
MISKALLVGTYQRKAELIARHSDVALSVIVPERWQGQTLEAVHTEGNDLCVEPVRFGSSYHLHHYPTLAERIAAQQPDLIHIDEEPYNLATFLALRAAGPAKTLFFTWQNIHRRYPPPFGWMERQVLSRADYALVGNPGAQAVLHRKGYTGPLSLIPQFGVDPVRFQPREGPRPDRPFTIGFAGRLVR